MTKTNPNFVLDDYSKYILLDYRQKLLRVLLVTSMVILFGLTIFDRMGWLPSTLIELEGINPVSTGITITVFLILLWMNQKGYVPLVGWIFCLFLFTVILVSYGTLDFPLRFFVIAWLVVIASFVIQPWAAFLFTGASIISFWWLPAQSTQASNFGGFPLVALIIIAIGAYIVSRILNKSISAAVHAYDETIQGWANALELRNSESMGHSQRVLNLTLSLARKLGIRGPDLIQVRRGVLLHDIGKMGIPDAILHKPGALTEEEWGLIRKHPDYARDYFSGISYLSPAMDIPFFHHEKWDGTGYPHGLQGDHIPLPARIFAVADVWDVLMSDRSYRDAWTREKALQYIHEQSGKHFDPRIVEMFVRLLEKHK
ncbi:MAG TPA: HD domain-containing phosphohydrolase [Anaerolineales bacterium]|nr:HD domain-containing phosphohydrolase [Anaerolineales bacterium]